MRNALTYYTDADGLLTRRGSAPSGPTPPTVLLEHNFDNWALGKPSSAFWNSAFTAPNTGGMGGGSDQAGNNLNEVSVVNDTIHGGRALRHLLRANATGDTGGTAMVIPLKQEVEEITMELHFRFVGNFDYKWGGKLPGIAGTAPGYASSFPSGGNASYTGAEGFSNRIMWHGYDANGGYSYRTQGEGSDYIYDRDSFLGGHTYGENLYWNPNPPTTQTYGVIGKDVDHVAIQHIKLNDIGVANGVFTKDFNGVRVVDRANRTIRTRSDVKCKWIYWSWFRGGSGPDWESLDDHYVDLYYIKITAP